MTSINGSPINHITSPTNTMMGTRAPDYSVNEFKDRKESITNTACGDTNTSKSSQSSSRNSPVISLATDDDDFKDYDEIGRLFETKSLKIEKWLRERASQDILNKVHNAVEHAKINKRQDLRASSVTSDLFQQWLATSPIQVHARAH